MFTKTRITFNNLSYLNSEKNIFSNLNLTFLNEKYGVVGPNGIGKSTLLKLILGELSPTAGTVQVEGELAYCPQEFQGSQSISIAKVLGVADKLQALQRIKQGSIDESDFTMLADDWEIEEHVYQEMSIFSLGHLHLDRPLSSLSGGELTRLLLAKTFLTGADFIILDEPTNNLDLSAREALYQAIINWRQGMIIVAHDRELLSLMDNIIEISSLGIKFYGGNYAAYIEQKHIEQQAAKQALLTTQQIQQKAKMLTQERRERHEQAQAKGRRTRKHEISKVGNLKSRIELNSAKGRSEKTQRKIILQGDRKLFRLENLIDDAKSKVETRREITVDLAKTKVPNGKMVLEIKNVTFQYQDYSPIIENFSLYLQGPQRIALIGDNGSGKTTLVKLIQQYLKPQKGLITLGVEIVSYLDQKTQIINPELTVLNNFLSLNPDIRELDARYFLADFLFRNDAALKLVKNLSSGEKLRAALACILMSAKPPQLLILDEPTNHLDLDSIVHIESALKNYQGSMIVISHDLQFLKNIGIEEIIKTPLVE